MQKACEIQPSTMAAILGLEDEVVEKVCAGINAVVVPANYNSPGQIVISGSIDGIDTAIEQLTAAGAKRAIKLPVGGAFHSPLMEPARIELEKAIDQADFNRPVCPVYQNVTASPEQDPAVIRENLKKQLTAPVKWTQSVKNMLADGATAFYEVGPGTVLQGLIKKVDRTILAESVKFKVRCGLQRNRKLIWSESLACGLKPIGMIISGSSSITFTMHHLPFTKKYSPAGSGYPIFLYLQTATKTIMRRVL